MKELSDARVNRILSFFFDTQSGKSAIEDVEKEVEGSQEALVKAPDSHLHDRGILPDWIARICAIFSHRETIRPRIREVHKYPTSLGFHKWPLHWSFMGRL